MHHITFDSLTGIPTEIVEKVECVLLGSGFTYIDRARPQQEAAQEAAIFSCWSSNFI